MWAPTGGAAPGYGPWRAVVVRFRSRGSIVLALAGLPRIAAGQRTVDLAVAAVAAFAGVGAILMMPQEVGGEDLRALGDMSSPAFFPALAALLLTILGALLAGRTLFAPPIEAVRTPGEVDRRRVWLLMLLVSGYMALIFLIGMLYASIAFIPAAAFAYGSRQIVAIGVLAITIPASVHVLFERILRVLLPEGWLL